MNQIKIISSEFEKLARYFSELMKQSNEFLEELNKYAELEPPRKLESEGKDMFLKRSKYYEMRSESRNLRSENSELQKKNEDLSRIIEGERVTGDWCGTCKNHFSETHSNFCGKYTTYGCLLNVKCENYEKLDGKDNE